jgi:hypothetical protein
MVRAWCKVTVLPPNLNFFRNTHTVTAEAAVPEH